MRGRPVDLFVGVVSGGFIAFLALGAGASLLNFSESNALVQSIQTERECLPIRCTEESSKYERTALMDSSGHIWVCTSSGWTVYSEEELQRGL